MVDQLPVCERQTPLTIVDWIKSINEPVTTKTVFFPWSWYKKYFVLVNVFFKSAFEVSSPATVRLVPQELLLVVFFCGQTLNVGWSWCGLETIAMAMLTFLNRTAWRETVKGHLFCLKHIISVYFTSLTTATIFSRLTLPARTTKMPKES